jgi:hypothetical protein
MIIISKIAFNILDNAKCTQSVLTVARQGARELSLQMHHVSPECADILETRLSFHINIYVSKYY